MTHKLTDAEILDRAVFDVDGRHHLWWNGTRPVCLCGYIGNERKRSQTEHITSAVVATFNAMKEAAR